MAFDFLNSFGSQPPPKRLTYEEILAHLQPPAAPEAPTPYGGFGDLSEDQQRGGKLDALWAGLAALSSGMTSGHWGQAATQGTGAIQDIQANAVHRANAQQESAYQAKLAAAQQKAEQERAKQQAAALAGMYNRATVNEDPAGPFAQQAADAAQRGDMSALEKMASPETQSQRASAKARGLNPDAWDSIEQLKATLKDNIAKQSLETLSGPEAAAAAAKAKAEQEARLPGEMRLKMAPSYQAPTQYEPLERIAARTELVESIHDRHEGKRAAGEAGVFGGKVYKQGEQLVIVKPPDAKHPEAYAVAVTGQAEVGDSIYYRTSEGRTLAGDKRRPDLGVFEIPQHEIGDKGYKKGFDELFKKSRPGAAGGSPPPARSVDQKVGDIQNVVGQHLPPAVLVEIKKDLAAGRLPRDIVADLYRDNPSWKKP